MTHRGEKARLREVRLFGGGGVTLDLPHIMALPEEAGDHGTQNDERRQTEALEIGGGDPTRFHRSDPAGKDAVVGAILERARQSFVDDGKQTAVPFLNRQVEAHREVGKKALLKS
jgi:hypothetical protein